MDWLVETTMISMVTAIIILSVKRLFGNKISPLWHYYIWFVLIIQLAIPFLPESRFSMRSLLPISGRFAEGSSDVVTQSFLDQVPFSRGVPITWGQLLLVTWLVGVVLFATVILVRYLKFKRQINRLSEMTDERVSIVLNQAKADLHVKRDVKLVCHGTTPMMVGLVKPVVLMPESYEYAELKPIFYHELTHLKYFDVLISWITVMLRCLFWFNPLIWYSFKVMQQDSELVCDYRVVKRLDLKHRKLYAYILLKYASMSSVCVKAPVTIVRFSMTGDQSGIRQRIGFISNVHNRSKWRGALAVLFTVTLALTTLTTVHAETAENSSQAGSCGQESEQTASMDTCCYQSNIGCSGLLLNGIEQE